MDGFLNRPALQLSRLGHCGSCLFGDMEPTEATAPHQIPSAPAGAAHVRHGWICGVVRHWRCGNLEPRADADSDTAEAVSMKLKD